MQKVVLAANHPAYGNCVGIYKSLSFKYEVVGCFHVKRIPRGYAEIEKYTNFRRLGMVNHVQKYFVVGVPAFDLLKGMYPDIFREGGNPDVTVILTDSEYRTYHQLYNKILKNYRVFAMPDLGTLYPHPHKVFYHPYEGNGQYEKHSELTIAHSPSNEKKAILKGTIIITDIVNALHEELGVKYDLIVGETWREAIRRKSRAHLFVDQVIDKNRFGWSGGLGKSGVEAMAAGVLTFTSGMEGLFPQNQIPKPPVVNVTADTLHDQLLYYIKHEDERIALAKEQQDWVKKYLNYEYQSEYLIS
jgi:hypothetical protein